VVILNVNPEPSPGAQNLDPAAGYEIKIDTDGDLEADIAYHVAVAEARDGGLSAALWRATGMPARGSGAAGSMVAAATVSDDERAAIADSGQHRFFIGMRSDPHFKDVLGFRNDFQFTGDDPVAKRNVVGIAIEAPTALIAPGPVQVWGRTVKTAHGQATIVDQAGRPGTNNAFNDTEEDVLEFDATPPTDQVARFGERFRRFLASLGYGDAEVEALLPEYLPDVLGYDPSWPPGYPNGRRLTDDTGDLLVALLTKGRITSDLAGPHTDLLAEFPYLGPPHPDPIGVV